jgi:hypothetical protein
MLKRKFIFCGRRCCNKGNRRIGTFGTIKAAISEAIPISLAY